MGGFGWIAFSMMLPPAWDSSKSRRLILVLRFSPIASEMEGSSCVWLTCAEGRWLKSPMGASGDLSRLNTSKLSLESKTSTISSSSLIIGWEEVTSTLTEDWKGISTCSTPSRMGPVMRKSGNVTLI